MNYELYSGYCENLTSEDFNRRLNWRIVIDFSARKKMLKFLPNIRITNKTTIKLFILVQFRFLLRLYYVPSINFGTSSSYTVCSVSTCKGVRVYNIVWACGPTTKINYFGLILGFGGFLFKYKCPNTIFFTNKLKINITTVYIWTVNLI